MSKTEDVWVFGYASLMWKPEFDHIESQPAHLYGYHRALCVYSHLYRGTPEIPGLVAGLLPGGSCKGVAFRVAAKNWDHVHQTLHDREMIHNVYIPKWMHAVIKGNKQQVFGYIANPDNEQYAGGLANAEIIKLVSEGIGIKGSARDYLAATLTHLTELGIRDNKLEHILAASKKD